ncbi:MAG: helix-turn-helix domain-containing protein [bacterium]|nr:helix-turn-helix domain-containing protein [bacterium]MCY4101656.1 helix-turn-helix domain-containing protein [bacterium]
MAQRVSFEERVQIEMLAAGVSVEEAARRLGRHRSTVHRELRRGSGAAGYDAAAAQAGAKAQPAGRLQADLRAPRRRGGPQRGRPLGMRLWLLIWRCP